MSLSNLLLGSSSRAGLAEVKADRTAIHAEHVGRRLAELESRVDRLSLVNLALWTLLQERVGLTEDELMAKVQELDLRDGKLDGRMQSAITECPECSRPLSQRHRKCLYCDYKLEADDAFDGIVR
jgi:hypothetical protein